MPVARAPRKRHMLQGSTIGQIPAEHSSADADDTIAASGSSQEPLSLPASSSCLYAHPADSETATTCLASKNDLDAPGVRLLHLYPIQQE
jgi:hypothetical protein